MLVPENRQTGGTGPGHSEALSSANVQSEAHPPSDDEVTEVKHEDDEVAEVKRDEHDDQHVSMVQLHNYYVPYYSTTTYLMHSFWKFHLNLLSKMVTVKIKFSYDS
jgi:hypothetical protein